MLTVSPRSNTYLAINLENLATDIWVIIENIKNAENIENAEDIENKIYYCDEVFKHRICSQYFKHDRCLYLC